MRDVRRGRAALLLAPRTEGRRLGLRAVPVRPAVDDPAATQWSLGSAIDYNKCSYSANPSALSLAGSGDTWTARVLPILQSNCGGCHGGENPQGGLNLLGSAHDVYTRLVDKPSLQRPDLKPPTGWSLSLLTSIERIRSHALSPDGQTIACIKDGESLSDVHLIPSGGGWLTRVTSDRPLAPYWDDEIPSWSPDGRWIAVSIRGHVHLVPRAGGLPRPGPRRW